MYTTTASVGNWTDFVSPEKMTAVIDDWVSSLENQADSVSEPLKLIIETINKNGKSRLEFSEPTVLPSFLNSNMEGEELVPRRL